MLSHGWRRFLLLVAAGAIAALSVPPLFVLPALFVGLPIWVWCLDGAERHRGLRAFFSPAFGIGFAFGLGYFAVALHWIGAALLQEGGWFIVLMPFAVLALAAVLALFWAVASALAHLLWSGGALRIVTLATFLSAAEFARGHLFSGFPFDLLGYALTANDEMLQLASVVGVYGLTLLAALLAMTPALIWPADERGLVRRLTPFFLAVAAIAAPGRLRQLPALDHRADPAHRHEGAPGAADDHRPCRLGRRRPGGGDGPADLAVGGQAHPRRSGAGRHHPPGVARIGVSLLPHPVSRCAGPHRPHAAATRRCCSPARRARPSTPTGCRRKAIRATIPSWPSTPTARW